MISGRIGRFLWETGRAKAGDEKSGRSRSADGDVVAMSTTSRLPSLDAAACSLSRRTRHQRLRTTRDAGGPCHLASPSATTAAATRASWPSPPSQSTSRMGLRQEGQHTLHACSHAPLPTPVTSSSSVVAPLSSSLTPPLFHTWLKNAPVSQFHKHFPPQLSSSVRTRGGTGARRLPGSGWVLL